MATIATNKGSEVVSDLVWVIMANRDYLSEVDGAIGDGDHGINMSKGFGLCRDPLSAQQLNFSEAFELLGNTLMGSIGGSMGPLYGMFFLGMSESVQGLKMIDAKAFGAMMRNGLDELMTVSDAKVGDKCMLDTLVPAVEAYEAALEQNGDFKQALPAMCDAARKGRDATRDLVAKIGRASRLGERSRGPLDAGATSCCLLLVQLAESVESRLS